MGAIVSHRKDPRRRARIEQKSIAVNAFSGNNGERDVHLQPDNKGTFQQPDPQSNSRPGSSANIAVASWGEGVVGTSTHTLHKKGVVASRGVEQEVKSSKDLYYSLKPAGTSGLNKNQTAKKDHNTDFARVSLNPSQPSTDDAAVIIQSTFRSFLARKQLEIERNAAINIQRHVRGFQCRKELHHREESAKIIQRGYHNYQARGAGTRVNRTRMNTVDEEQDSDDEKQADAGYRKPWRESTTTAPQVLDVKIGEKTKESFNMYQDDIADLKWKTEQQIEMTTVGEDYIPPRIVIIASNVPRSDVLEKIVKDDVLKFGYDFAKTSLKDLIDSIAGTLERFKGRSRARSIGFVCQGGPGFLNPVKGKMITKAKLKQDEQMRSFWQSLGTYMTKLTPEQTKIHLIGQNVTGNQKGEKLVKFLSELMKPSVVKLDSPLELSPAGREMLALYFDYEKYKVWKSRMHSKVSFQL